nr:hypothetical protein [Zoogloeaceae bacterium]
MKIAASNVQLQSSHLAFQRTEVSERLETWSGERGRGTRSTLLTNADPSRQSGLEAPRPFRPEVALSNAGRAAQQTEGVAERTDPLDDDPRLKMLRLMIEFMTGRSIKLFSMDELSDPAKVASGGGNASNAARDPGFGIDYQYSATRVEVEQLSFAAQGMVRTADGREISFEIGFSMERSFTETINTRFTAGSAAKLQDPLVLDFGGPAGALSDLRFAFDLDADGTLDQVPMLAGGTGFLAFDRNANGRIDDGKELFGPTTGAGFDELARLDSDGNGWIDEADPAFAQLRIWRPDANGEGTLQTLAEAGVGALYLGNAATPFDLRNGANETLGVMRSSSIYLRENGSVGTVSQIDLSV